MRKVTIVWFDQFLDDYKHLVELEYQKSETEILEGFAELENDIEEYFVHVNDNQTVGGQPIVFRFFQVKNDFHDLMQYEGWVNG